MWIPAASSAFRAIRAVAASARACGDLASFATLTALAEAGDTMLKCVSTEAALQGNDEELEARAAVSRGCIEAQIQARRAGLPCNRPRDVLPAEGVAMRNVGVHDFQLGERFVSLSPEGAKRQQRGGQRRQPAQDAIIASTTASAEESSNGDPLVAMDPWNGAKHAAVDVKVWRPVDAWCDWKRQPSEAPLRSRQQLQPTRAKPQPDE